jgi:Tol biopolymer transport system component
VSFPTGARRQAQGEPPSALDGVLAVHDIAAGTETQVLDNTVTAFQWSPDGSRLALLDPGDSGAGRWRFWAGAAALVDGPSFVPSQTSAQLVFPYFDQLATSTRWWAPDGSAFTFAGRVQGREGVWVLPVATGGAATFVHDGDLVAWSWQ